MIIPFTRLHPHLITSQAISMPNSLLLSIFVRLACAHNSIRMPVWSVHLPRIESEYDSNRNFVHLHALHTRNRQTWMLKLSFCLLYLLQFAILLLFFNVYSPLSTFLEQQFRSDLTDANDNCQKINLVIKAFFLFSVDKLIRCQLFRNALRLV